MNVNWDQVDAEVTVDEETFPVASVVHATLFSRFVGSLWQTSLPCPGASEAAKENCSVIGNEYVRQFGIEDSVTSMVAFIFKAHRFAQAMKRVFGRNPMFIDPVDTNPNFVEFNDAILEATFATGTLSRANYDKVVDRASQDRVDKQSLFQSIKNLLEEDNELLTKSGANRFNRGALTMLVFKTNAAQLVRNFGQANKFLNDMHEQIKEYEGPIRTRVIKKRN